MSDLNLKISMTKHGRGGAPSRSVRTTVYLSPEAREILDELRLLSLDRNGNKPDPSQIIEGLLKEARRKHRTTPYPT